MGRALGRALGWTGGCPLRRCLGGGVDGGSGFAPVVSGNFLNSTTSLFTTGGDIAIGVVNGTANCIVGGADPAKLELSSGGSGKVDWRA